VLALLLAPGLALAQFHESFEGPEPSWRWADHDCSLRVVDHARTFNQAQSGQASEFLHFQAGSGTFIHLVHTIPPARVIGELQISVYIKSNQSGLQLAARVVLPRTKDPRTGKPHSLLIRGASYAQAGTWQKLTIDQPALLASRQVPMLRSQLPYDIDEREAYVDLVVLNVFGGPGRTELWTDDLEINGLVSAVSTTSAPEAGPSASGPGLDVQPAAAWTGADASPTEPSQGLLARPQLVRAIDYRGESMAWLKSIGFNAVVLVAPPSAEQAREAAASGVWLVAPPPGNNSADIGTPAAPLLAWYVDSAPGQAGAQSTRHLALQLRSVPEPSRRPILCVPHADIAQASRIADLLVLQPPCPNGTLPLEDLSRWYEQRVSLMRMGTQFWGAIPTQIRAPIMDQIRALGGDVPAAWSLEPEQIRLLTYHALASGARGLWFRSDTRLDSIDRHSVLRAKVLHRLNLELNVLEPWAATGDHEREVAGMEAHIRASVLKTERSRLLLVLRRSPDQQYVAGLADDRPMTIDVAGVPETDEAYRLVEDGLQRIRPERGTGTRITLDDPREISMVVLTQDQLVLNFLARQLASTRELRNELSRAIAAQLYATVVETHQQLLTFAPAARLTSHAADGQSLSQARAELQHFERLIESGGDARAYQSWERGLQQLAATRYDDWKSATESFPTPVASPLCVSFFALPYHHALSQRLCGALWGPNTLAGGDFEELPLLQSSGWRNWAADSSELATSVELSRQAPQAGQASLRLQCWPRPGHQVPTYVEAPAIAITSAPMPVRMGQILRIHGWVRVPHPIQASVDGLLIYDSLAGADLAERILAAPDWREFTLYRAAPAKGTATLTFALTGIGEAWLDQVTVNVLEPAPPGGTTSEPTGQ